MTKHEKHNYTGINIYNILKKINNCFMKKEERAMHLVTTEEKVAFYLLTYGFNIKRKYIKEKKEVLEVLIH